MKTQHTRGMVMLPYALDALAPHIGRSTMEHHYDKHYRAYVDNTSRIAAETQWADAPFEQIIREAPTGPLLNNAGQAYNHAHFFTQLSPHPAPLEPESALGHALRHAFGSIDHFQHLMLEHAVNLFGSGWTWLFVDAYGQLHIDNFKDGDTPLREGHTPLLCIDCWEHAYYLDYQNRRAEYLDALWHLIDWRCIGHWFEHR
jgi:Fe-Mn family superoxide dismutase